MEEKIRRLKSGEEVSIYDKQLIFAISKRIGETGVIIARQEENRYAVRLATSKEHIRLCKEQTSNNAKELKEFLKIKIFWEE